MAWEENSRISLHMQLIAILSRIGVVKYHIYKGTSRMKLLDKIEILQLRDIYIFEVNGIKVYR